MSIGNSCAGQVHQSCEESGATAAQGAPQEYLVIAKV